MGVCSCRHAHYRKDSSPRLEPVSLAAQAATLTSIERDDTCFHFFVMLACRLSAFRRAVLHEAHSQIGHVEISYLHTAPPNLGFLKRHQPFPFKYFKRSEPRTAHIAIFGIQHRSVSAAKCA